MNTQQNVDKVQIELAQIIKEFDLYDFVSRLTSAEIGTYRDVFEHWIISTRIMTNTIPNKGQLYVAWTLLHFFDSSTPEIIPSTLLEAVKNWSEDSSEEKLSQISKILREC